MEQQQQNPEELRKRKFLLVAPLLILPFVVMFFWALGGGKAASQPQKQDNQKGPNINLPNAHLPGKETDKMAYYQQAAADSAAARQKLQSEQSYGERMRGLDTVEDYAENSSASTAQPQIPPSEHRSSQSGYPGVRDPNEERVYKKLDQLNHALSNNAKLSPTSNNESLEGRPRSAAISSRDIDRLENMMKAMKPDGQDQEMSQIDGVLDKILAVQHPEIYRDDSLRNLSATHKRRVLPVSRPNDKAVITYLPDPSNDSTTTKRSKSSRLLSEDSQINPEEVNVIEASVPFTQTVVTGANLQLVLTDEAFIAGVRIPSGTPITGIVSLTGERLQTQITSIRFGKNVFPVSLQVYDQDGVAGILIPGSIGRDITKQSADQGMGSIGVASYDPSLGAQATQAGVDMAKSFLRKKVKLVRVTIPAGHAILLKGEGQE